MRVNIKKYEIYSKKNLNIVHISDIHYCNDYKFKRLEILSRNIKKILPDYICITGDLIDSSDVSNEQIDKFCEWLTSLSNNSKIIIVLGNHDIEKIINGKKFNFINKYFIFKLNNIKNIYLLRNDNIIIDNINFIGYEAEFEYKNLTNIEINDLKNVDLNILLIHDPSIILNNYKNLNLKNIDLILCGHTHGGLTPEFIPGNRGIISPDKKLFPKNVRGIFYIENTILIISSGVTKLSKRSHLTRLTDLFSANIVNIILKTKVIKSKNI